MSHGRLALGSRITTRVTTRVVVGALALVCFCALVPSVLGAAPSPDWDHETTGENIGAGPSPEYAHAAWMSSAGHRANVLGSSSEFGYAMARDAQSSSWATEDFGSRSVTIPVIPSAAVLLPRYTNTALIDWTMLVNFYDAGTKTPVSVSAVYDGARHPLARVSGTATNGSWASVESLPQANAQCRSLHFEVVRSDNQTFRWPASGIPVVTIQAPATGARVARSVTIRASAIDNGKVVKIELWIDGRRAYGRRAATLTRQWNAGAATVTPGPHTITVKARDEQGNAGSSTITVQK